MRGGYMHPRPEPQRDIAQVRQLLGDRSAEFTDEQIDEAVERARAQIGGLRKSRCVVAAQMLTR